MEQRQRVNRFRRLHEAGTFVLPNAWDGGSAAVIGATGAKAIATTSSGISWAAGRPDGESLSLEEAISALASIVRATELPVSADLEAGYGERPADVESTIEAAIEAGAIGSNLEDRLRHVDQTGLWSASEQGDRLAAARATAERHCPGFVINARTDVFLAAVGEPEGRIDHALERAKQYALAGADCLFVPGLNDIEQLTEIVRQSPLPVNALLAPGSGVSIAALEKAGIRRVSVGHLIAAAAYTVTDRAAREILNGTDQTLRGLLPHPELQQLMARV